MVQSARWLLTMVAMTSVTQMSAKTIKRPAHAPASCSAFLPGKWAGSGTVTEFGPPMRVDSTASYKSDGTFASSTRYLGQDKKWTEQKITGIWSVKAGKAAKTCTLALKSVTSIGESSSTSDFAMIDADSYRSFGVDLKRVR